jgi:hypothetical protein
MKVAPVEEVMSRLELQEQSLMDTPSPAPSDSFYRACVKGL